MIPLVKRNAESWRIGALGVFISRCVVCNRAWKVAAEARPETSPEHRCWIKPRDDLDDLAALIAEAEGEER